MWNKPSKERLARMPGLYETETAPLEEKRIHLHFFIGGCDWYAAEFDGKDLFWGYVVLNDDFQMAEWGYFSFRELCEIRVHGIEIDCEHEFCFPVRKASEIDRICKGNGWTRPLHPETEDRIHEAQ